MLSMTQDNLLGDQSGVSDEFRTHCTATNNSIYNEKNKNLTVMLFFARTNAMLRTDKTSVT